LKVSYWVGHAFFIDKNMVLRRFIKLNTCFCVCQPTAKGCQEEERNRPCDWTHHHGVLDFGRSSCSLAKGLEFRVVWSYDCGNQVYVILWAQ
jgi:hypothetical protein